MVNRLDEGMCSFARVIEQYNGIRIADLPGAGAAGGLGGGFKVLPSAELLSGIDMILDAIGFDRRIEGSLLVFTGEGKLDAQTALGKTPVGVLRRAARQNIPVIALGGSVEECERLNKEGFAAVFPILPSPVTLAQAMERKFAQENLIRTAEQIMRVIGLIPKQA